MHLISAKDDKQTDCGSIDSFLAHKAKKLVLGIAIYLSSSLCLDMENLK